MSLNKNIYISMLEIGYARTQLGITYDEMKTLLEAEGYDFSDPVYKVKIRAWFYSKFFNNHTPNKGDHNIIPVTQADKEQAYLYGDATLQYLDYLELKQARKSSRNGMIMAIVAILIAAASPFISNYLSSESDSVVVTKSIEINLKK